MNIELEKKLISIVMQFLEDIEILTPKIIRATIEDVVNIQRKIYPFWDKKELDKERLAREIEALCNVFVPMISIVDDTCDHQEWL